MTYRFLETKFYIPPWHASGVARPRLVERLHIGFSEGHKLTLISAPAGYGKSTLVTEWLAQAKYPAAWLSLDKADDEALRFFTYFIAALRRLDGTFGAELAAALEAGQLPPVDVLVTTLVAGMLLWDRPHILVLDDFQDLDDATILDGLQGLLEHQPYNFHLVIVTREDPPLSLARLRVRNQLTEIRAEDLRFDGAEAEEYLCKRMGLALSREDLAVITERTEGWVAGLKLAGLSLQGEENPTAFVQSLSGSHRFILGYLTEEVLRRQPGYTQEFLLQTSILSKLTGELCDAVTGRVDSSARLEDLLTNNLFLIPLDEEGRWYRYHHLFADLLFSQLRRLHPEWEGELHQRASRWYEATGMPGEAIEHALSRGDYPRATGLLEQNSRELLNRGYARQMEAWLQSLPVEWRAFSPRTSLGYGWMYLLRGNYTRSDLYLKQAREGLDRGGAPALQAECLALEANLMQSQGRVDEALQAAGGALGLTGPEDAWVRGSASLASGSAYRQSANFDCAQEMLQEAFRLSQISGDVVTGMLATSHLVLMSLSFGRLRFAADAATQALEWLERSTTTPPPIVGTVHGGLGFIYLEWNEVIKARQHLLRGIQHGMFFGHNASVVYTKVGLARLQLAEGDSNAAERTLSEANAIFQQGAPGWERASLLAGQVGLALTQNRIAEAESILRPSGVEVDGDISHKTEEIHLAWLRLLLAQGQAQSGLALAERILVHAEDGRRNGTVLQTLVLGARALVAMGDLPTGLEWLGRALALAEPEGYMRIFLDEGPPMARLLRRLTHVAYAQKLLAAFPVLSDEGKPKQRIYDLIEPLSDRELEVLRLLSEGLTYAEIAGRLVLSLNTVRYHVKRLYAKLGVEKQAKAIERARGLGLI